MAAVCPKEIPLEPAKFFNRDIFLKLPLGNGRGNGRPIGLQGNVASESRGHRHIYARDGLRDAPPQGDRLP